MYYELMNVDEVIQFIKLTRRSLKKNRLDDSLTLKTTSFSLEHFWLESK